MSDKNIIQLLESAVLFELYFNFEFDLTVNVKCQENIASI